MSRCSLSLTDSKCLNNKQKSEYDMKKKFEFVRDLTSDVLFKANGKNLEELFENSALALMSVMCDTDKVLQDKKIKIQVKGKEEKDLLYNWLQEIIATVDIEGMFFSKFKINKISNTELTAEAYGEEIIPEKGRTVVKAVTYYKFDICKIQEGYSSSVSLDI
jgi:SHS2 domain-containing protein